MPVMGVRVYVHTETTLTTIDKLFFFTLVGFVFSLCFFSCPKIHLFFRAYGFATHALEVSLDQS